MSLAISSLRDNFDSAALAPAWDPIVGGSATVAQVSSQLRFTLPSSTAGAHGAYVQTPGHYDLTGDSWYINIQTMVSTAVAATAYFDLRLDSTNYLRWVQLSGTIYAAKVIAGVSTTLFSVAWSSSTYKYLRIRETGGNIEFHSSTNGTSWTLRATITGLPFAVTDLSIVLGADCGNVATPGSFRLDDVNLILPALSTNWHLTQVEWTMLYRFKTITISAGSGQGYLATAAESTSRNADGTPNVLTTPRYFSGPIGSSSGGYDQLTEYSTQAAAQAMAVNMPLLDGRWDLPDTVECRIIRLYHRSITGSAYALHEYYPRRLVQSDDMEAESIRTINLSAGSVTADKIFVLTLGAITANIGKLNIDATGYLYQGTGTGDVPITGLKIFNSGGIGKLSTYNTSVEQVTLDTDGVLKAGAGNTYLDASGANIIANTAFSSRDAYKFVSALGGTVLANWAFYNPVGGPFSLLQVNPVASKGSAMEFRSTGSAGFNSFAQLTAQSSSSNSMSFAVNADSTGAGAYIANLFGQSAAQTELRVAGRLNVGSGVTGFGDGEIRSSGAMYPPRSSGAALFAIDGTAQGSALSIANNGTATPFGSSRNFSGLLVISETAVNGTCAVFVADGGGGVVLISASVVNTWTTTATTASRTNVYLVSGAITIENKLGSTASYNVMALRTRTS